MKNQIVLPLLLLTFFLFESKGQNSACLASDTIRIVVIGSSTAAGAGVSTADSSWVNRYRRSIQALNTNNEVINLARGGYNTWRLMPDYFNAPSNRPQPDTLRNISHALRQNPDAIVINLPSNDAAINTGINEQMSNFIHMDSLAASMGVPVWVCTTQPRNFNASQIQIQLGVRDSVFNYFGTRSIDFWNGLANTQNTIDSTKDSGDGVHVNDAGHRLLWQRVIQKAIPDSIVDGSPGTDLRPYAPVWLNPSNCGNPNSEISVRIGNLGEDSLNAPALVQLIREDLNSGIFDTLTQSLNLLQGCSFSNVNFNLNTSTQQNWRLKSRIVFAGDNNPNNNQSGLLHLKTSIQPSIISSDTVLCDGDSIHLSAFSDARIRWFTDPQLQNEVHQGDSLQWFVPQTDSLFLQSYQGPFSFNGALNASSTNNIRWNGCMFNLIAGADTVFIDSIEFPSGSTADLQVNLRTRPGSYKGYEAQAMGWSPVLSDSIYGAYTDSLYYLDFGTFKINPFDTLGCYLYLENSSHRLRYQWANSEMVFQNSELSIQTGTGVGHTFGTSYFPRHYSGKFFYHFGYNPQGQCQSEIDTLIVKRSAAQLQLQAPSVYDRLIPFVLRIPNGFTNPIWNDGSTADSLWFPASSFNDMETRTFWLEAQDSLGCLHRDTITVRFQHFLSQEEKPWFNTQLYPNPNNGTFTLKLLLGDYHIEALSLEGKVLKEIDFRGEVLEWNSGLPSGLYLLRISNDHSKQLIKLRVE